MERKHPMAKRFRQVEVAPGIVLFLPVVNDLDDGQLQLHFDKALSDEDYEYAQALQAEATHRDFQLKINEE